MEHCPLCDNNDTCPGNEATAENLAVLRAALDRLQRAARRALASAPAWQDQSIPLELLSVVDAAADLVRDTAPNANG